MMWRRRKNKEFKRILSNTYMILKTHFLIILSLLFSLQSFSQSKVNIDSLIEKMCYSLNTDSFESDSASLINMFAKHLGNYEGKISPSELDSLYTKCFFKLQKSCKLFKTMLDKIDPGKGDWITVSEIPVTKISKLDCEEFFSIKKFKYLESTGDTVNVNFTGNYWIECFTDASYSKLVIKKISSCDFELIFEESDNLPRKNMSNPGDRYKYRVLEKNKGYFLLLLHLEKSSQMFTFKMYY